MVVGSQAVVPDDGEDKSLDEILVMIKQQQALLRLRRETDDQRFNAADELPGM